MADVQLRYIPNSEVTIHIVNLCKRPPGWKSATRGRKRSGRKKATLAEPAGAESLLMHHGTSRARHGDASAPLARSRRGTPTHRRAG